LSAAAEAIEWDERKRQPGLENLIGGQRPCCTPEDGRIEAAKLKAFVG